MSCMRLRAYENVQLQPHSTLQPSLPPTTACLMTLEAHRSEKPCLGPIRRREFLRAGRLALGGVTLGDVLALRAAGGSTGPQTSVILFWMWGGPSQLET